jgi:hypothetical protein
MCRVFPWRYEPIFYTIWLRRALQNIKAIFYNSYQLHIFKLNYDLRPGREADISPPSSTKVKNAWSYTSTLPYVFVVWCLIKVYVFMMWHLVKHGNNLTFNYTYDFGNYILCIRLEPRSLSYGQPASMLEFISDADVYLQAFTSL